MKPLISKKLLFSILFIGIFFTGSICLYQVSNAAQDENISALTFKVLSYKKEYLSLEPIVLTLELKNPKKYHVTWLGMFRFSPNMNILVTDQNASTKKIIGKNYFTMIYSLSSEVLKPGESKTVRIILRTQLLEDVIKTTGKHRLQLEFQHSQLVNKKGSKINLLSNPIDINIKKPKGKNFLAHKYLRDVYYPNIRHRNPDNYLEIQEYFVNNFQGTVYWKYKTYQLGKSYFSLKRYDDADREFLKITERCPGSIKIGFFYQKEIYKFLTVISGMKRPTILPLKWLKKCPPSPNAPGKNSRMVETFGTPRPIRTEQKKTSNPSPTP